ncbi:uncharacterized protein LOC135695469 [Rhopilema esculentum]|uniref:uncharacterized protein LOC135695469 n=1 Tax=Rhopilema esculentum TaxID=499914 RepID=UPI0031CF05FA
MVSTATQADMDYEAQGMKDASCHVSLQELGVMKSTASQTEGADTHATSLDQIASSESLKSCKSDVFYDARESRTQSQEEVLNYEEVVPRSSSIMGHLKYMMGPFQSFVEANSQNAKKAKTEDRTEEGSDMVLSRSQRSSIRSEASLEDVIECDSDHPATPF